MRSWLFVVVGLFCLTGIPALAQTDVEANAGAATTTVDYTCKARAAYHHEYDAVRIYDNLQDFFETFSIVEEIDPSNKETRTLEIRRIGEGDVYEWIVEFALVPAAINTQITNIETSGGVGTRKSYEITLAQFFISFKYEGPRDDTLPYWFGEVRTKPLLVVVKIPQFAEISQEQVEVLIQSMETKQPVRIKGQMTMRPFGRTFEEIAEALERRRLLILEINGQPVTRPN